VCVGGVKVSERSESELSDECTRHPLCKMHLFPFSFPLLSASQPALQACLTSTRSPTAPLRRVYDQQNGELSDLHSSSNFSTVVYLFAKPTSCSPSAKVLCISESSSSTP
jgi:hypothetical protein